MSASLESSRPREPRKLFLKHIVRKIFFEDWALKLLALVITFGLWFGVTGLSTPTTKRFTVPLVPSISNNAEITNTPIEEVDIVISGDKRKIDQINRSDLVASLDLTDVPPGDRVVSLTPANVFVALPQGIKLDEVQPSRIAIKLEAVEEKEIEVRAQTDGQPAVGFEVYTSLVQPARVRVRGPAGFIKTLDFIETDRIDLSGRKEEFTARQVPVSVANPKAAVLNTVVDVYIRIGERRVEKRYSIAVPGSPARTATFTIFGPRSLLAQLRSDAFKVEPGDPDGDAGPRVILPTELQDRVEVRNLTLK
jgi:YbbR domain-containing protein